MKKEKVKKVLEKVGKTFVEGFVSYLSIDLFAGITDFSVIKKLLLSVLLGAVAAGISAVWNLFQEWIMDKFENEVDPEDDVAG